MTSVAQDAEQILPDGAAASLRSASVRPMAERIGYVLVGLFVFFTCFTFLRPSPYDFFALPAMLLWFVLGIRLHRPAIVFVALLLVYKLSLVLALVPYISEEEPVIWTLQSLYLMVTAVFFVMFFSDRTIVRVRLALNAYLASCIFAAAAGILSFFLDNSIFYTMDGRAAGVFEDPNVLGSFLILGVFHLLRGVLTGDTRRPLLAIGCMCFLLAAIFLSFSRGSWLALALGTPLLVGLTFRSSGPAVRRRIALACVAAIGLGAVLVGGLLSLERVGEQFEDRAQLTQSYDEGVTGRFGNQLRSIPMLLERPAGFGPLRYRLIFLLEPHNSFIGGFANGGWLGGFAFLGLVLATVAVGFRICLRDSPYQAQAQVAFPALLMFFLQAFQIDIDHWRHVYMLFGMIWALECARAKWASSAQRPLALPGSRYAPPALTAGVASHAA